MSEVEIETENATIAKFANFLKHFKTTGTYLHKYEYVEKIAGLNSEGNNILTVNSSDLYSLDNPEFDIYSYFFTSNRNIDYHLKLLNEAVREVFKEYHPMTSEDEFPVDTLEARIRIDDDKQILKMKQLLVSNRNKLVAFDTLIIAKSEVKNTIKEKKFRCNLCNGLYNKKVPRCANAECEGSKIVLSVDDSVLADCEFLELQERQDDLTHTTNSPIRLNSIVYGDLVGKYKAGDNVRVTGVLKMQRTVSDTVMNRQQEDEFVTDVFFERIVEIHNLELLSTKENSIINDPSKYLTEKDEREILQLRKRFSDDNQFMTVLEDSFAPHIYKHNQIKQSVLLQRVGSIEKDFGDYKVRKRSNILLVGDPGTEKTLMLIAAANLSINGHMASGKGTSGVGLTASHERDQKGIARVRIGKAVMAHNGHVSLDEFGQVKAEDQSHLLDILESGYFRIDKAGINVMLNADASYLIATNPDNGKYNTHNSLFDNLSISPQFFSRIHMVWVLTDVVNKKEDRKKALHILSSYDRSAIKKNKEFEEEEAKKVRISSDLLFKYLLYASIHNTEDITFESDAMDILLDYYDKIRAPEKSTDITATGRQFVGLISFAISRCRLMLRNVVIREDAIKTVELFNASFHSCGMIIESTGGLNLTMQFGKPLHEITNKVACFTKCVQDLTINPTTRDVTPVPKSTIIDALIVEAKWLKTDAEKFFDEMYYKHNKMMVNNLGEYQLV